MTPILIAALGLLMVATAFLSGLFGMAGGHDPDRRPADPPAAADRHGAACGHADGVERLARPAVARAIRWRLGSVYLFGCTLALGLWRLSRLRAVQAGRAAAARRHPVHGADAAGTAQAESGQHRPGSRSTARLHLTDAADRRLRAAVRHVLPRRRFRPPRDRRHQATCQVASHFTKLVYFGGIIDQAATLDPVLAGVAIAASMLGTTLARRIWKR